MSGVTSLAETDARGEYRTGDLWATDYVERGGRPQTTDYDVVVESDRRFDGRGAVQRRVVSLRSWEERVVDFGGGGTRWSGRLLNAFDEPFAGTPRLELSSFADSVTAPVGPDGRFQCACDPGRWRVRAFAAGCPAGGFDLGEVEVPAYDFAQDLIVPGTRLQGRILAVRDGQVLPEELTISLCPKGHDYPAAFRDATTAGDGAYSIDGLSPGEWLIGAWPGALEAPLEITILEGVRELDQELRWVAR